MNLQISGENYLKTILLLQHQQGYVRAIVLPIPCNILVPVAFFAQGSLRDVAMPGAHHDPFILLADHPAPAGCLPSPAN